MKTLAQLELELIEERLEHFKGNKTQAALSLGITIKTLYNKLHQFGLFDKYKYKINGRGLRTVGASPALGASYENIEQFEDPYSK